ncbi:triacylglycerol lipase [Pseudomonas sp. GV085]|uniref:esterase/lipase family protein n=1 Tax=Pseudomonas sp. GV085 TaxID=2135756 RepID=UPI000D437CFD|nr:hypothetical protein [Pseudomonas sp. GV085]PTR29611.1 hypothetical protein C8K63_101504 [Pseudomonas sp. GV085]
MNTSFSGVITLIHGTFASNAEWITATSEIYKKLSATYPNASVNMFQWSGGNSHRARTLAGLELASTLETQLSIEPEKKHILIAHSHGGNVALYAMRNKLVASAVTKIVFLSTPFFHAKKRETMRMFSFFGPSISWLLIFPIYMPFGDMALRLSLEYLFFSADTAALLSLIISLILIWYYAYKGGRASLSRWLSKVLPRALERKARFYLRTVSTPEVQCQWLALYTSRDEALLWLKSLNFISAIPLNSSSLITSILPKLWPVVVVCSVGIALATYIRDGNSDYGVELASDFIIMPYIIGCLLSLLIYLLGYLIPPLIRGNKIGFGSEGVLMNTLISILPSAVPDSSLVEGSGSYLFKPSAGYSGLRHSASYADPEAIDLIVSFVGGKTPSYGRPRTTPNPKWVRAFNLLGAAAIITTALYFIYYEDIRLSGSGIKEIYTSLDPSLKIVSRRMLAEVKESLQPEITRTIPFSVNHDFAKQHCHLAGLYGSDSRSSLVMVSLDDWYTLTQAQIDTYKQDKRISEDLKSKLKPMSEPTTYLVLHSFSEHKWEREFWFEKHPRTNLQYIKSGEITISNTSEENSANINFKLYLDCYAQ